ncbi:MAG: hypothetical protein ABSG83_13610, partial [Roseiarcus sp.]
MAEPASARPIELGRETFDDALGRRIIQTHIWAVREGLRGASAYDLLDGYCQRLVIGGAPLWRAHAAMETLHPQWSGYGYTWRRDLNAIEPEQYAHVDFGEPEWLESPLYSLVERARRGQADPSMRRRLEAGPEQRDYAALEAFFAAGATDYFSQLFAFGEGEDRSQGSGVSNSVNSPAEVYFSPRVGISYDVFGKGNTFVRGGWGVYRNEEQFNPYALAAATAQGYKTSILQGTLTF